MRSFRALVVFAALGFSTGCAGLGSVGAKGANGNAAPIYSIAGSATRLRPHGITIARTGEINVANKAD